MAADTPGTKKHGEARAPATPLEVELKLELAIDDEAEIRRILSERLTPLSRGPARSESLLNIYFDTPEHALRDGRVALRLRRLAGPTGGEVWLQTLKTAGSDHAGLSRRGEWESPVNGAQLDEQALAPTPWRELDPKGKLFAQLMPAFSTDAERTLWLVEPLPGQLIEVALDIGHIRAGDKQAPIRELELELRAGPPAALFDLAASLAKDLPLLPAQASKAERGYRLAQGTLRQPRRAQPVHLQPNMAIAEAGHRVLGEMLNQFNANLVHALHCDRPELVHQARVGWRRFRSGWWLFRRALADAPPPALEALRPLRDALGRMRDLDVMAFETLSPWAEPYIDHDDTRAAQWQELEEQVSQARQSQRAALLDALRAPATGAALIALAAWLERLHSDPPALRGIDQDRVGSWARARTRLMHERLQDSADAAAEHPRDIEQQHEVRLLAKRTRYGLEALGDVLPEKKTSRWTNQATAMQTGIGEVRDLMNLVGLLEQMQAHPEIRAFIRGVITGRLTQD